MIEEASTWENTRMICTLVKFCLVAAMGVDENDGIDSWLCQEDTVTWRIVAMLLPQ